jgi:serine/threonine protein kinase
MALEAAKGMLYLHSRVEKVLHRDLKSANLLVDKHWRVKVADFNLSRVMNASAVVSSVSATNPRRVLSSVGVEVCNMFSMSLEADVMMGLESVASYAKVRSPSLLPSDRKVH